MGDVVVVLLVAVCGCGVAALVCGGDGGVELAEQLVVQFCGVFGVDPEFVGVGEGVLVGPLVVLEAPQFGEFVSSAAFGRSAAAQDVLGESLGVLVGGVAAGA